MRRKKGVIGFFVPHRVAANLVMLVMLLGGVLALTRMNIQFFPTFALDVVSVRVVWSGASAEDVEQGITNPLVFNREYKRLAQIFHGTCVAYDKAYEKRDDEMLSRALWRNLLNQDPAAWEPEVAPELGPLVVYVKKQKVVLKFCDPVKFAQGQVPFAPFASIGRKD